MVAGSDGVTSVVASSVILIGDGYLPSRYLL